MSGSDASASDDELWEVEKIVDQRFEDEEGNKIDVQYRVRWKGFPPGEDTWEPMENLQESLLEVEAFKERRKRRDRRREEKRIRKERLFNAIPDPNSLPAIPVFDVSMDIAARPLMLPTNFDENKWELAEPFMCPFCGKINDSQDRLRSHQLACKPLKRVLSDVKKLQEMRPMSVEPQTSQESLTTTVMSENEAPEMDELIQSPAREKNKDGEGIDAVEKIAKEMGMNVMRVDDDFDNKKGENLMPEMKELPPNDSNMSVDNFANAEDEKEDQILACAPDVSSTDTADENTDEKQLLAEKDLNKSMSDEEYKQFLYTPPKACSTQKSASQESNTDQAISKVPTPESSPENPPTMEEMDLENDVYEELVETTVEEDEPMPVAEAVAAPKILYLIPLNFTKPS